MNQESCNTCGIVIDVKKIKMEKEYIDEEGNQIDTDTAPHDEQIDWEHNPDLVWSGSDYLDTWQCPVCKSFNGVGEND